MSEITQQELKFFLDYNPKTGVFFWLNPNAPQIKPGKQAGTINSLGYVQISLYNKMYSGHRLAWLYMTGEWPPKQIDHVNGDKTDNSWKNLRLASSSQNLSNAGLRRNNTSGEKGVSFHKNSSLWRTSVTKNYKEHVSYHKYWWQAVRAVRRMREELHGEYFRHE